MRKAVMRCKYTGLLVASALTAALIGAPSLATAMPRYDHIFIIIAENKNYDQIIGNVADAPNINRLASQHGLATRYYGVAHPSEPNYVALLGGSTFGIRDDDAWYCQAGMQASYCENSSRVGYASHSIAARSLMQQLEEANMTWKGYFEDLPAPGSTVIYDPSKERPDPLRPRRLYGSKHNGFMNFDRVRQDPHIGEKIVPLAQLSSDLADGRAANYAHIVLNQCNDMHGLSDSSPRPPEDCILYPGIHPRGFKSPANVIRRGDRKIFEVVEQIRKSPLWQAAGNAAIVVTFDEDAGDTSGVQGCCGYQPGSAANFGGGHVATIVVTNHGSTPVTDPTPYNHYSLLRSCEEAFGITQYLGLAAASDKGVKSMTPLFEITGRR
jgi:hypothetical protein